MGMGVGYGASGIWPRCISNSNVLAEKPLVLVEARRAIAISVATRVMYAFVYDRL